jgi:hypothetical protein
MGVRRFSHLGLCVRDPDGTRIERVEGDFDPANLSGSAA